MVSASSDSMTALISTLQNWAIFWRTSVVKERSARQTRISGCTPISCSALTECWVGLVFNSWAAFK